MTVGATVPLYLKGLALGALLFSAEHAIPMLIAFLARRRTPRAARLRVLPILIELTLTVVVCICGVYGSQAGGLWIVALPVGLGILRLYQMLAPSWFRVRWVKREVSEQATQVSSPLQQWVTELASRYSIKPPLVVLTRLDHLGVRTVDDLPSGGIISFGRDLVGILGTSEVRALAAHELGHLCRHDMLRRAALTTTVWLWYVLVFVLWTQRHPVTDTRVLLGWLILMLASMQWVTRLTHHRMEFAADRFAADVLGDAAPLQHALARLATIRRIPVSRSSATHPSIAARVKALNAR